MIRTFLRHIREALKNLVRNAWMTFASVSAVAITLLILGASLIIALNAQQMSNYIAGQLEIDVFLKMTVTDTAGQKIAAEVKTLPGVRSVQFISREQGFKTLEKTLSNQYGDLLGSLSQQNTLPDKLVVKVQDPTELLGVGQQIRTIPGVDQVQDGKDIVTKLLRFLNLMRNIGFAFVAGLLLTAMFLISNTVRIAIFSRRREIEIMKLVGATNWFIRWPFLVESLMIGAIGAVIPYAVLVFGYNSLYSRIGGTFLVLPFPMLQSQMMAEKLAIVMFGLGLILGLWGGIMSIRKFLRA